ncbi:T9SS type B sorting domain-containing protein [Confluentibacter sediminis]|uniref:T9SS type B sorting domain-containing protein n=1 Tax=Confluentibacter sediminis TaxID=2219045 RepID=UPI000DABB39C|nr:T9SS type B sorting domain-containing protein [Confluentibacter sediminis]
MTYRITLLLLLFNCVCISQVDNKPPNITAVGDQYLCPSTQSIPIVTSFNITDEDDKGIESFSIQISSGYVNGVDKLSLTGSHPNIVPSWNPSSGKLKLTGIGGAEMIYADLIAAVKDVVYESLSATTSGEKFFSFTIGDANYLPSTGHYYEYIAESGITWSDARIDAANHKYYGLQGYLATILTADEAQLSGEQAGGVGWLGGTDEETEGVWKWVTGPPSEAGTVFWNGGANGSTPNYANWNNNEPNNLVDEDYIHVTFGVGTPGSWNDLPNIGGTGSYFPQGYIVEYGGMPGDPIVDISASTKITILSLVKISDIPPMRMCDTDLDRDDTDGFTEFDLTSYKTILLNGSPASEFQINYFTDPAYANTDEILDPKAFVNTQKDSQIIYVRISNTLNTSCYTDTSFLIQVDALPVIQPSIVFKNCDGDADPRNGFTDFNLNEINDIITNDNSANFKFTYYLTSAEANSGDAVSAINPVPFNNATSDMVYVRVENASGCYRVSTVNLDVSTTSFPLGYMQELPPVCDDDAVIDGLHEFDLTAASQDFIHQFPQGQNLTVHYYRNLNDAHLEFNEITNQTNYLSEVPFSQVLYVRVESEDNGDCFGIGPYLTLTVHPRPEFEVKQSNAYCFDNNPITLSVFNPKGTYTYEWRDSNGFMVGDEDVLTLNESGTYTVIAISDFGCESFPLVFSVEESAIANMTLDDISIVEFSDNNSITINTANLGIGDYEFSLDDSSGPYQDEPVFNNVAAGVHTIYVQDKNGCGIVPLEVFVLGFPKYFTPNGDGHNDRWNIKGLSETFPQEFKILIFDRYGKLIKQLNPRGDGWDGTCNGQRLTSSDYWFMVDLLDAEGNKKTYRGHFSLVR